jgi:hypothetical protein
LEFAPQSPLLIVHELKRAVVTVALVVDVDMTDEAVVEVAAVVVVVVEVTFELKLQRRLIVDVPTSMKPGKAEQLSWQASS